MSNTFRITKADIIGGRRHTQSTYIPALGGEVEVRPLTSRQLAQINAIKRRGIKITTDGSLDSLRSMAGRSVSEVARARDELPEGVGVEIDMEAMSLSEYEANVKTVLWGLVLDEKLTEEEVHQIRPDALRQIAEVILQISGEDDRSAAEVAAFRQ